MKNLLFKIFVFCSLILGLSSCHTTAPKRDYSALAKASVKMKIDITHKDNHKLYIESAGWIGTPYRVGGMSKSGTDCSGLTTQLYKSVYGKNLPRSSKDQKNACKTVSKRNLREGDLLFFSTDRSKKRVGHVGIYLKNGKFIHASTTSGVRINRLDEPYYVANWISGGRVH